MGLFIGIYVQKLFLVESQRVYYVSQKLLYPVYETIGLVDIE